MLIYITIFLISIVLLVLNWTLSCSINRDIKSEMTTLKTFLNANNIKIPADMHSYYSEYKDYY